LSNQNQIIGFISHAILAGEWQTDAIKERIGRSIGYQFNARLLIKELMSEFELTQAQTQHTAIQQFLKNNVTFQQCWGEQRQLIQLDKIYIPKQDRCRPPRQLNHIELPALNTEQQLGDWFKISVNDLIWLSGIWEKPYDAKSCKLYHYHYQWLKKHNGKKRLVEIPKSRIKSLQKKISIQCLDSIPIHQNAHGYCKNKSCQTLVQQHIAKPTILKMDLQNFFASIDYRKIFNLFFSLGYNKDISRLFAHLCTTATPLSVLSAELIAGQQKDYWHQRKLYRERHLPTGAPSSPVISNLCFFNLDCRLTAFAEKMGLNYSRYVDDMVFSGGREFYNKSDYLIKTISKICQSEYFFINHKKTQLLKPHQSQQVCGLVVNQKPNLTRKNYDQLKAILYNCVRTSPKQQNRLNHANFKEHLAGKIAYLSQINPQKGQKLADLFDQICWME
jgi:RNA-directed DNA polymerase